MTSANSILAEACFLRAIFFHVVSPDRGETEEPANNEEKICS